MKPLTPIEQAISILAEKGARALPRLPKALPPSKSPERELERILVARIKRLQQTIAPMAMARALGVRGDASAATAASERAERRRILKQFRVAYQRKITEADPADYRPVTSAVDRDVKSRLARQLAPLKVDVIGKEPWLKERLTERAGEIATLIKDAEAEYVDRVASLAMQALAEGKPAKWMERQLEAAGGAASSRAKLQARDQIGKLQGALMAERQQSLGITSFRWRTSRDERVVGNPGGRYPDAPSSSTTHGDHWEREGREFLYVLDGGRLVEVMPDGSHRVTEYADGLPGDPIQDRCWADPVIPSIDSLRDLSPAPVASAAEEPEPRGRQPRQKTSQADLERLLRPDPEDDLKVVGRGNW